MSLPYWVSPIRYGRGEHGAYLAVDVAKSRDTRRSGVTVRALESEFKDMTAQERSKHMALKIHDAAKSIGLVPEQWKLI